MTDTDTQLAILADALVEILDLVTTGHSALASPTDLLERAGDIAAKALTAAMSQALSGSDAEGASNWKTAYDAREAAQILFLRKFGPVMRARAGSPAAQFAMLAKVAALLPTHTKRAEESQALQQFSTPIGLSFVAGVPMALAAKAAAKRWVLWLCAYSSARGGKMAQLRRHQSAAKCALFRMAHFEAGFEKGMNDVCAV